MAWNEPGGGDKDPWSGKGGDQGPPDLDEVVRNLQDKFGGLFGKKKGGPTSGGSGGGSQLPKFGAGFGLIALVAFIAWLLSGIYIIEPAERGVVLRFGGYADVTQPGPHWRIPYPIDEVIKVNVDQFESFRHKAEMLTRDENIVDIELTVQYRIQDAADYLFQDQQPTKTIRDATETAVRETIGKSDLDFILTEGRGSIASDIQTRTQALLNTYKTGLEVMSVNTQPAKPPEQVKSAFDDAIKAREDKERLENEAEAYANEVIPTARGAAARVVASASAYRDRVIASSEGEASRFLAVLKEYEAAPEVTRERLYLEMTENALANSGKVLLDVKGGNNLMYLPLDKIIQQNSSSNNMSSGVSSQGITTSPRVRVEEPMQDSNRGRRVR